MQTIEMDDSVILTDTCRQLDAARLKIAELEGVVRRKTDLIEKMTDLLAESTMPPCDRCGKSSTHSLTGDGCNWWFCDECRPPANPPATPESSDGQRWPVDEGPRRLGGVTVPDGPRCTCGDGYDPDCPSFHGSPPMPLDRAHTINAACCDLVLRRIIGEPLPGETEPNIAKYTLAELLEAKRVIKAEEDRKAELRQPGEGYTLHTTCDDRLLSALYACQHYEGQDQEEGIEPIAVIGRKAIVVVNLPERRDEE